MMRITLDIAIIDGDIQDSAGDDDKCDYVTVFAILTSPCGPVLQVMIMLGAGMIVMMMVVMMVMVDDGCGIYAGDNGDGQDGADDDDKCDGLGHPHPTRWPWGQRGAGTGIN